MKNLDLFLVSSPLQILAVNNINAQYLSQADSVKVLFIQGRDYIEHNHLAWWDEVVYSNPVRPHIDKVKSAANQGLSVLNDILLKYNSTNIRLYISDLYWTFNNMVYAYLSKQYGLQFSCSLFDEGMIIYAKQVLDWKSCFRSWVKYFLYKFQGLPYTPINYHNFEHRNKKIKSLFVYHPDLFSEHERVRKSKKIDPEYLNKYFKKLEFKPFKKLEGTSVLYLSQPYSKIIGEREFISIIDNMVAYFTQKGVSHFVFKAHHLDSPEWINFLIKKYNFSIFEADVRVAIESYANMLPFNYVVSHVSSALMNLELFGYEGKVVSYGLEDIAKVGKLDYSVNIKVFEELKIEMVG